jgi:hypothetical protein
MTGGSESIISQAVAAALAELRRVDPALPDDALPLLRAAQEHLTVALDEAMAATVVEGWSMRSAGALAGLSENAVPPRLARTNLLRAYGDAAGRVTRGAVERARYDLEMGRHPAEAPMTQAELEPPKPMRFRARRPD